MIVFSFFLFVLCCLFCVSVYYCIFLFFCLVFLLPFILPLFFVGVRSLKANELQQKKKKELGRQKVGCTESDASSCINFSPSSIECPCGSIYSGRSRVLLQCLKYPELLTSPIECTVSGVIKSITLGHNYTEPQ
jgi:hypothetical protein